MGDRRAATRGGEQRGRRGAFEPGTAAQQLDALTARADARTAGQAASRDQGYAVWYCGKRLVYTSWFAGLEERSQQAPSRGVRETSGGKCPVFQSCLAAPPPGCSARADDVTALCAAPGCGGALSAVRGGS